MNGSNARDRERVINNILNDFLPDYIPIIRNSDYNNNFNEGDLEEDLEDQYSNTSSDQSSEFEFYLELPPVVLQACKVPDFQVVTYQDLTTEYTFCSICQDDIDKSADVVVLNCKHLFHSDCIKQWCTVKLICPNCKSVINN
jgi:hypothetical protein